MVLQVLQIVIGLLPTGTKGTSVDVSDIENKCYVISTVTGNIYGRSYIC